jgi:hypothetical protein
MRVDLLSDYQAAGEEGTLHQLRRMAIDMCGPSRLAPTRFIVQRTDSPLNSSGVIIEGEGVLNAANCYDAQRWC